MPNTIVHLGLQGLAGKAVFRGIDLKWIWLGCIIPDLPWVVQRLVKYIGLPEVNLYDMRLYSIAQASFFSCLLLCTAIALLTNKPLRVLVILGLNSLLHLLLDACQTKWANGVHLWAPLDWHLVGFGLFWPENVINWILTGGSLVFVLFFWNKARQSDIGWEPIKPGRWVMAGVLLALYVGGPVVAKQGALEADNHFVGTLLDRQYRTGREIEFDRVHYKVKAGQGQVYTFAKETIRVDGVPLSEPCVISLKGVFTTPDHIRVTDFHLHFDVLRSLASMAGLVLVGALWSLAGVRRTS